MIYKVSCLIILLLLTSCGTMHTESATKRKEIKNTPKSISNQDMEASYYGEYIPTRDVVKSYQQRVLNYVDEFKGIAMEEMRKYGIPASITLAQGILESGAGQGTLALNSNNHFGIKCHDGWQGETVRHDDDKKGECFRKYNHPNLSYEDHSLFLVNRNRYEKLFDLKLHNYKAWAKELKRAGYATDPKYPAKLIRLIETYYLADYDKYVLKGGKINRRKKNKSISKKQKGREVHIVRKGDTLYSLSRRYDVSVERIMRLNGLKSSNISLNQRLVIK